MIKSELLKKLSVITEEEKSILSGNQMVDRSIYVSGKNVIDAKKLLSQGKLITARPHTRFIRFPEHTHNYVEAIYMCSGKTMHIINGEELVLNEGELLFLSRNAKQEIMPADENDIAVNFIILPEFFSTVMQMLDEEETPLKKFIIDSMKQEDSVSGYLHFKVADIIPIQNLIENLIWNLVFDTANKRKINATTMGLLFMLLINNTDRLASNNDEDDAIIKVLRYIEDNYVNASLYELARLLHYDFAWLSREIKRRTGDNYTTLIQKKRISQACFLLKNTNMNIDDIALNVGYSNISYFHRLFKQFQGVTPREYRICK